jgi:hypothetical protein
MYLPSSNYEKADDEGAEFEEKEENNVFEETDEFDREEVAPHAEKKVMWRAIARSRCTTTREKRTITANSRIFTPTNWTACYFSVSYTT